MMGISETPRYDKPGYRDAHRNDPCQNLVGARHSSYICPMSSHQPQTYHIIRQCVQQIPRGKVSTYGEIAKLSGFIGLARMVGYALHNTPPESGIPWHRVVNAQGRISLPKHTRGHARQRKLLVREGIAFSDDKIDLVTFGWLRKENEM